MQTRTKQHFLRVFVSFRFHFHLSSTFEMHTHIHTRGGGETSDPDWYPNVNVNANAIANAPFQFRVLVLTWHGQIFSSNLLKLLAFPFPSSLLPLQRSQARNTWTKCGLSTATRLQLINLCPKWKPNQFRWLAQNPYPIQNNNLQSQWQYEFSS